MKTSHLRLLLLLQSLQLLCLLLLVTTCQSIEGDHGPAYIKNNDEEPPMSSNGYLMEVCYGNELAPTGLVVSEGDILRHLLDPSRNYSKDNRPVRDARKSISVLFGLRLLGIQDFIERENTLILNAYLTINWHDEWLVWNESHPYRCVPQVSIPASEIWVPDVILLNAADRGGDGHSLLMSHSANKAMRAILTSDGSVDIEPLMRLAVSCDIDLMFFPFDKQICQIRFESWVYPRSMQRLWAFDAEPFQRNAKTWTENEHWRVIGNRTQTGSDEYPDGTAYDYIIFKLHLERKALFFYINIIIPCLIISVVEIVIFALPIVEVIKMHISFTCLLAYTVFQTMSISDMPKSGDSVPLLSMYISCGQGNISLALFGEALVFILISKAQMKKERCRPALLLWASRFGRIVGVKYWTIDDTPKKPVSSRSPSTEEPPRQHALLAAPTEPCHTKATRRFVLGGYDHQWLYLAEVVERYTCIFYILAIIVTPFVVFVVIPAVYNANTAPATC